MQNNQTELHGMSRLIYESLQRVAPEVIRNGQIVDCRLLQKLEEQLHDKLVKRGDGSSRLVIDLVLTRSMKELKQKLIENQQLHVSANSLAVSSVLPSQIIG